MQQLIPLTDEPAMKAAGLPFKNKQAARWCRRMAQQYGLTEAFVQVGGRVYIDPAKFHELARANSK